MRGTWELFWKEKEYGSVRGNESMSMFEGAISTEEANLTVERAVKAIPIEAALRDLEELMGIPEVLQKMLTVCDDSDSFIRILLRIDTLQTSLIDLMLEIMTEHAHQLDSSIMSAAVCSLILRHIRWIEFIKEPIELVQKLVSTLPTYPLALQKDIIHVLPELVPDENYNTVIDTLLEFIGTESTLVVAAVEALSNFNIPAYLLEDVVTSILNRLSSSPVEDLPPLVRFLLQAASTDNMVIILSQMREKLSECILSLPNSNEEALLCQQFVQGLTFRADVMNAFLKMIQCIRAHGNHCILDIWGLLGLYSLVHLKPKIEAIFKKKVASGLFTKELFKSSITNHFVSLEPSIKSLLQLIGTFYTATDIYSREMGILLFRTLFMEASQQSRSASIYTSDIIADILGHCVSSSPKTVDAGLETLHYIITDSPTSLISYLPSLKQLLDFVDKFTVEQCRQVYQLLIQVGGTSDADLAITIRKQLYHQDNHYRKLGMIGCICLIEEEIKNSMDMNTIESTECLDDFGSPQHAFVRKVKDSIEALKDACRKMPKCLAFMYAELNHLVVRIPQNTTAIQIISDCYSDILASEFLPNFNYQSHQNGEYKIAVMGGAFRTDLWAILNSQSLVYLDLMNVIASPNVSDKEHLEYLCNLLHLVVSCSKRLDGLESIGTVLVCPIMLLEKSILSELKDMKNSVQEAILLCLWYATNWCRELVNCFSCDVSLRSKVMSRLENAVEFEALLNEAISSLIHSSWVPPGAESAVSDKTTGTDPKKPSKKGKGKVGAAPIVSKLKAVQRTLAPVHPIVMSIIPDEEASVDPQSLRFLFVHFRDFLRLSLAKTQTSPSFFAAGATVNRYRPELKHEVIAFERGMELFKKHLQPKLSAVKVNARWALGSFDLEANSEAFHDAIVIYLESIVILANSDLFRQQRDIGLQCQALQDLVLLKPLQTSLSQFNIIQEVQNTLFEMQKKPGVVDDLELALHFIKTLNALEQLKRHSTSQQGILFSKTQLDKEGDYRLGKLAHDMLVKNWWANSKNYKPSDVFITISAYLNNSGQPLDAIQEIAVNGFANLLEQSHQTSENYPTLSKKTVGIHLRACCETLVHVTSRLDFSPDANSVQVLLHYLTQAALLFKFLVGLTKSFQSGTIITTVLKHASGFIENLLRAMPFFEMHFRQHSQRILKIMLEVQGGTRKLQILCAHGKSTLDSTAASHVPKMKKLLEKLIYGGERLARENNVMDAYTTGVLKHRNIDGTSIKPTVEESDSEGDETESTHDDAASEEDEE
ncbi:Fanconi anemia group D2 protein-like [Thraustotheca clavata]|uniref:Fanconi anemia group D2 protein-like n=1 Tax=Thraustotheca clavata TaxID=74557 RepID=A0A1V9ZCJ7_9STRA|nr:Fanconi anemia group D2 protein-like [Thraustotheca clavata]